MSLAVCHCPYPSSPAHCLHDLAAYILWQLPLFPYDIHCLKASFFLSVGNLFFC